MTSHDEPSPRWVMPALVGIVVFATFTYSWGAGHTSLEVYYQAAVRSMGSSWHDFFYGAFDPRGTITVDKLPGALWVQALSVRAFGYHPWAIVLPQIVEGVLTVLVLYRAVSRVAGPIAGLVAALVMAATPATVALNRGNISDSLLILFLVLAANATVTAVRSDRARWLALAGLWVGLAFQAKMLQAWFVLPSIAVAWVLASSSPWRRRVLPVVAMAVVAVLVSLSWMTVVALMPRAGRPFVDGSAHDSEFVQVFSYNGFTRIGQQQPTAAQKGSASSFEGLLAFRLPNPAGPTRLLTGAGGRDVGWLVPMALVAGAAVAIRRRRSFWADPIVASTAFWGSWLVIDLLAFSFSSAGINAYYLAALTPAIGALLGIAVATFGPGLRAGDRPIVIGVGATVVASVAYGLWLTLDATHGVSAIVLGTAAVTVVVLAVLTSLVGPVGLLGHTGFHETPTQPGESGHEPTATRPTIVFRAGVALGLLSVFVLPLAAGLDIVHSGLGPFDTPYQPAATTRVTQLEPLQALAALKPTIPLVLKVNKTDRYLSATDSSVVAAPLIVDTGREFEPIGGFLGANPTPSLAALKHQIAAGQVQTFIVTGRADPRVDWVRRHCLHVTVANAPVAVVTGIGIYVCPPRSASG